MAVPGVPVTPLKTTVPTEYSGRRGGRGQKSRGDYGLAQGHSACWRVGLPRHRTQVPSIYFPLLSCPPPPQFLIRYLFSPSVEVAASPSLLQTLAISCESDSVLNLCPLLLEPLVDPNTRRRGSAVGRGGPELQREGEGIAVVVGRTNRRKSFCSSFKMLPLPGSHP